MYLMAALVHFMGEEHTLIPFDEGGESAVDSESLEAALSDSSEESIPELPENDEMLEARPFVVDAVSILIDLSIVEPISYMWSSIARPNLPLVASVRLSCCYTQKCYLDVPSPQRWVGPFPHIRH